MRSYGHKKIGRPAKMTEETVRKLESALRMDCSVTEACLYAEISRATYYDYCGRYREFSDKMDKAQRYVIMLAKQAVMQAIRDGNGRLALRFLERRQPERYGRRAICPRCRELRGFANHSVCSV